MVLSNGSKVHVCPDHYVHHDIRATPTGRRGLVQVTDVTNLTTIVVAVLSVMEFVRRLAEPPAAAAYSLTATVP